MKLNEINIRDPFILPFNGKYYLYGTRVGIPVEGKAWGEQTGFDVYVSCDLQTWSGPTSVFERTDDFWATRDFWAPEVHIYNGKFYMFATFKAENLCRGTHILVSDFPEGPFVPVSENTATPKDWECLDGTLYIDKNGRPHIVFCHEWLQTGDGEICEAELSEDFSRIVSSPRLLWRASDFKRVKSVRENEKAFVTDGPFLYRSTNGGLYCLWSSFTESGYAELVSKSDNNDIDGNWRVIQTPVSEKDGGHGMVFGAFDKKEYFVMHKPNEPVTTERPVIMEFGEDLKIKE